MGEKQPGQEIVEAILTDWGFAVTPIAGTAQTRHADLIAEKNRKRTILEIKARLDDPIYQALMPQINAGGGATYQTGTGKTNTFSGKVKEAAAQLQASAMEGDYRCLWFVIAKNQFADVAEQIEGTLLGRRFIIGGKDDDVEESANAEPCYILSRADFFRFPEIDAAVIDIQGNALLIVNPASPRYAIRTEWPLWQKFEEHGAVKDILREAQLDRAYLVPQEVPIKSDEEILAHVRKEKKIEGFLLFFDPVTFGAVTQVKRPEN